MLFVYCAIFIVGGSLITPKVDAIPLDYDFECRGLPENFLFWWACGSYGVCRGGRYVQVDCVNGTSYDRVLGDCRDNIAGVNFPCNRQPNCFDYDGPGHRYPELARDEVEGLPECTFYYTCSYGRYLGHQRCNEGTVYDQARQLCMTPDQVAPPCGTYSGDDAGSPFQGRPGFAVGDNGRPVISLPVDADGNVDQDLWPFTNNNNNNRQQGFNPNINNNNRPRVQQPPGAQTFGNPFQPPQQFAPANYRYQN